MMTRDLPLFYRSLRIRAGVGMRTVIRINVFQRLALVFFLVTGTTSVQPAEPTAGGKILIGMTTPLTGSMGTYAAGLEQGLRLGFARLNANGGIGGRAVELLVKDDAGDPLRATSNAQDLANAGILALTGMHGMPAIEAVLPMAERMDLPVIGVASGAENLREPPMRNVFNLRAGIRDETIAMVLHLDTIGLSEIAALAQDDALGRDGLAGVQFELARLAIRPQALVTLSNEASPAEVIQSVEAACRNRPQALVLALNARNTLPVIRAARRIGCGPQIYVTSEAGAQLAGPELAGVVVAQVLPAGPIPLVTELQRRLSGGPTSAQPTYPLLEGYVYAQFISEGLRRCTSDLTRRCLISALEARAIDAGGYRVQFSPKDRRGSHFVEMTIVTKDGHFRR